MKNLVLVKQTPDAEASTGISEDGMSLVVRESDWRMNGFDEFAVEEALRIREAMPGSLVDAVSVGPARVAAVFRRAAIFQVADIAVVDDLLTLVPLLIDECKRLKEGPLYE